MNDAETVIEDWKEKGVYETNADLYDEVWIYGRQDFYDPFRNIRYLIALKISFI